MAKNKKKSKKNSSFYKAIKPYIKDNRVLYSILGATGVGIALASVFGTEKGREIVDNFTNTLKNMGAIQNEGITAGPEQASADKKPKSAKQFAVETN